MRQLFLEKNAIAIKEVCQPLLEDNTVLVSVHYSFISSGTESATIENCSKRLFSGNISQKINRVIQSIITHGIEATKAQLKGHLKGKVLSLGYSCSGQIIAVGKKVRGLRPGDFVACAGGGYAQHADIVVVPENLVVKIKKEQLKEASITTIGAIAMQGIRRSELQLGEIVCVVGLGLLGQLTVQLAKKSGCTVIGIDLMQERLDLAAQLGADYVYLASEENLKNDIAFFTQHEGVDCTIITAASKSDAIVQLAMEITRRKGKVVLVGDVGLNLNRSPMYEKEIDFLISCSYGPGRYDTNYEQENYDYPYAYIRWTENRNMQSFVKLLEDKQIRVDSLISETISIDDAEQAYEHIQKKAALGIVLEYLPKKEAYTPAVHTYASVHDKPIFKPATQTELRVGFVGAGGFAQYKLMPIISKLNQVRINAIVDSSITQSINASRIYGAAKALTNDRDLFNEDLCDVVVIASPHLYHCDQIINALSHGKAVFSEKPMVTTYEQLDRLMKFLEDNKSVPFCVDYNRSFSPFMRKIKETIAKRSSPLVVHYRMNAGFVSKTHWTQTDIGAGRIIGEACHIFDLFSYLTDAEPVAVSVESLNPNRDDLFPTDNFSAQISYSDGSICSLLYTSLGHADVGKERMELYYDSKTIIMNNYCTLVGYGLSTTFNEKVTVPDKGHEQLIREFFGSVSTGTPGPISLERLRTIAHITLVIDELACQGGGSSAL